MTVSAGKKTFKNLRLENYRYDISLKLTRYMYELNNFQLLKTEGVNRREAEGTSKKIIKKCHEFIKILILISLKNILQNAIRLGIFNVFDNIFTANILGMWEKRRSFTFHAGMLLPTEPISQ